MVSVAILAAALWIIIDRLIEIVKRVKASEPLIVATMQSLKPLLLVITAIPTCVIGFTPGIIWELRINGKISGTFSDWEAAGISSGCIP